MQIINYKNKIKKGYVTILMVLVLLAITGTLAASAIFGSIDTMQGTEALRRGSQALYFSESCLENGLLKFKRDPQYSGSKFDIDGGSCEVSVDNNGDNFSFHSIGKNDSFQKNISAEVAVDALKLSIISWKEE